jgi:hypothetical protein
VWYFFEWYFVSVVKWTHTHTPAPESIISRSAEFTELTVESKTALTDIEFHASTVKRHRTRNPLGSLSLKTKFMIVKIILISSLRVELTLVANPVMKDISRIQKEKVTESEMTSFAVSLTVQS